MDFVNNAVVDDFNQYFTDIVRTLFHANSNQPMQKLKFELEDILSRNNFEIEKVCKELQDVGINSEKLDAIKQILEERRKDLIQSAIARHYIKYGEYISDFDWAVKVIMGTSELKTEKFPILELTFKVPGNVGNKNNIYHVKKDVLDKMIAMLENYCE